jgi:hypothetical protein
MNSNGRERTSKPLLNGEIFSIRELWRHRNQVIPILESSADRGSVFVMLNKTANEFVSCGQSVVVALSRHIPTSAARSGRFMAVARDVLISRTLDSLRIIGLALVNTALR